MKLKALIFLSSILLLSIEICTAQTATTNTVTSASNTAIADKTQVIWRLGTLPIRLESQPFLEPQSNSWLSQETGKSEDTAYKVKVAPNPFSDFVAIESTAQISDNTIIQITDSKGTFVKNIQLSGELFSETINLSDLPTGTYYLQIYNDDQQLIHQSKISKIQ